MLVDLTQYMWILWLVFIFVFVIIELLTLEFTFLMIAVGSLAGLGTNLLGWPWWVQIGTAAIVSALLLFTIRPLLLRTLHKGGDPTPSNVAALLGLGGRVVNQLDENGGLVKLANGETWTAQLDSSADGVALESGDRIVVSAIQGSTAVVRPTERKAE